MKDRAVTEMSELRRQNKKLQETVAGLEEEMARIRESMSHTGMKLGTPAANSGSTSSIGSRGCGSQQPSTSTLSGRTPSLSQVSVYSFEEGFDLHIENSLLAGLEISDGAATSCR